MTGRRAGDPGDGSTFNAPPSMLWAADLARVHTGVVETFDDAIGLGSIRCGSETVISFHCIAIADGSRTIAVGTPVAFTVTTGHNGKVEAASVVGTDRVASVNKGASNLDTF